MNINAELLLGLENEDRINLISSLNKNEAESLLYMWEFWAREKQIEPVGDWLIWLILAGRGWGKTRTGAEWIKKRIEVDGSKRIALIAPTAADARDVMVEGESGILNIFRDEDRPHYEPSKRRITFKNGAIATTFSADEPERLRGPQFDTIWMDEVGAWRYSESSFDMAMFGLRLGHPKCIITTTPKPIKVIKDLVKRENVFVTRGSTLENREHLASEFLTQIISKYEGTRLGRQELNAEILEDIEGTLWNWNLLDTYRVSDVVEFKRIVVSIDPAVSNNEHSNETGIVVVGLGVDGDGYVLEDLTLRGNPNEWARMAIGAYYEWNADKVIAESNNGGDMVKFTLNTIDDKVPVKLVHAARGKKTRAEPISSLYEQGKVHHVGSLGMLEEQMCNWIPFEGVSPDRVDALVWGLWELMISNSKSYKKVKPSGMKNVSSWNV